MLSTANRRHSVTHLYLPNDPLTPWVHSLFDDHPALATMAPIWTVERRSGPRAVLSYRSPIETPFMPVMAGFGRSIIAATIFVGLLTVAVPVRVRNFIQVSSLSGTSQ